MLEDHKQLRKLQLEQYKILQSVNDLCSKYGIEYYLLYGTLLGAVRHSKFIPWDYDIDIAMERTQFNRFKSVVQELPDWLEVWDICYSSIEYAGLSRVVKPKDCVFGDIHIDIFIIDNARITSIYVLKLMERWDAFYISRNSAKQRKIFFTNILKTARVKGLLSF